MKLTWEQAVVLLGCLVLAGYMVAVGENDLLLAIIPTVIATFARTSRDVPQREKEKP